METVAVWHLVDVSGICADVRSRVGVSGWHVWAVNMSTIVSEGCAAAIFSDAVWGSFAPGVISRNVTPVIPRNTAFTPSVMTGELSSSAIVWLRIFCRSYGWVGVSVILRIRAVL